VSARHIETVSSKITAFVGIEVKRQAAAHICPGLIRTSMAKFQIIAYPASSSQKGRAAHTGFVPLMLQAACWSWWCHGKAQLRLFEDVHPIRPRTGISFRHKVPCRILPCRLLSRGYVLVSGQCQSIRIGSGGLLLSERLL